MKTSSSSEVKTSEDAEKKKRKKRSDKKRLRQCSTTTTTMLKEEDESPLLLRLDVPKHYENVVADARACETLGKELLLCRRRGGGGKDVVVEVQLSETNVFPGSTFDRKSTRMRAEDFLLLRKKLTNGMTAYLAQEDVLERETTTSRGLLEPYVEGLLGRCGVKKESEKNVKRRVWMNHERVETTPHYDDYDNVLFVCAGRKTVRCKAYRGDGFHFCVANTEVANHAHPEALPDLESYEYTFVVNAGEAVFIPMGWIHRVESDEGTVAIAHELRDSSPCAERRNAMVSRLKWEESLYLIRRNIEDEIDAKFTELVSELIDSEKGAAHIKRKRKSNEEEGREVEFEIRNPEQFMENISQSCVALVARGRDGKEEGDGANDEENKIPKYRKDVLAMTPLQAKLHAVHFSLLKKHLGEEKFDEWIAECSLKYIESRGPEWKREDTCASIVCEKAHEFDFYQACKAVLRLAAERRPRGENERDVDEIKGDEDPSAVADKYERLTSDYKLLGGMPRKKIRKPFDPLVAAFGVI